MRNYLKKAICCMVACAVLFSTCFHRVEVHAETLNESTDLTVAFGEYDKMTLSKDELTTLKIVMTEKGKFEIDFSPKSVILSGQLYDENNNELCYTTGGIGRGSCYADVLTFSNFSTTGTNRFTKNLEPGVYYLKLWVDNSRYSGEHTFFARQIPSDDVSFEISIVLEKGQSIQLGTILENTTDDAVKWSSTKKTIASVSSKGKVKALKKGMSIIKAYTKSGLVAKIKVKVK